MITIVPAIDIIQGQCVRLTQGDYKQKTVYNSNPVEVAKQFEDLGVVRLHLVDLDGAKAGKPVNLHILESIATQTGLIVDYGGGIAAIDDFRAVFNAGAAMATGGSIAVKQRDVFLKSLDLFGSEKIILGADVKDRAIAIHGWQETTKIELIPFLKEYHTLGIYKTICTDISRDGMMQGPALDLYCEIQTNLPEIKLIASGGVKNSDDIKALEEIGVEEVIVGKALYEGSLKLKTMY